MTLHDLNCFIIVAETLSYTQTAQRLNITQPAVTKHIASLEEEFNVSLLDRANRRSICLTEAGEILYEALKTGKEAMIAAKEKMRKFSFDATVYINMPKGITLPDKCMKCYNDFAISILPAQVVLDYRDYGELISVLDNGEIVICEEEAIPAGRKYMRYKINEQPVPYCLIASADHPLFSKGQKPEAADFAGSSVYFNEGMPRSLKERYVGFLMDLFGKVPEIVTVSGIDSVYLYLHSGEGITLNTQWIGMANSNTMRILELPFSTDYYLIWNREKIMVGTMEKLLRFMEKK